MWLATNCELGSYNLLFFTFFFSWEHWEIETEDRPCEYLQSASYLQGYVDQRMRESCSRIKPRTGGEIRNTRKIARKKWQHRNPTKKKEEKMGLYLWSNGQGGTIEAYGTRIG